MDVERDVACDVEHDVERDVECDVEHDVEQKGCGPCTQAKIVTIFWGLTAPISGYWLKF